MLARVLAILAVSGLTACSGGSGSNPFGSLGSIGSLNPFGGRDRAPAGSAAEAEVATGVLVGQLERVTPEPALRGLILRASAIAPMQGYYGANLWPVNDGMPDERGIVTFEFRAMPPPGLRPTGPVQTRRLIAAAFIPDSELSAIRGFRVLSAGNSVDLRR